MVYGLESFSLITKTTQELQTAQRVWGEYCWAQRGNGQKQNKMDKGSNRYDGNSTKHEVAKILMGRPQEQIMNGQNIGGMDT